MDNDEEAARTVSQLSKNIAKLEESLEPLISTALSDKAKSLRPLEQAKLYTHVVYATESLLFSYLRLNGVKATEHPVFRELTRVKQYFEKIKIVENGPEPRKAQLDKAAAERFIKHGLAGNAAEQQDLKPSQDPVPESAGNKRQGDDSSKRQSDKVVRKKSSRRGRGK